MTSTGVVRRDWLKTGAQYYTDPAHKAAIEREVENIEWRTPEGDGPMAPVLLIQEIVRELDLRPVTMIGWGGCFDYPDPEGSGEWGHYGLVGVEVTTSKQKFRGVWLDVGSTATPLFLDWYEGAPAS